MSFRKEQETPLDKSEIEGMYFLDGDIIAKKYGAGWAKGTKDARIMFDSGREFQLWESGSEEHQATVHLFGEMDLPYRDTRDEAFERAKDIAEACGYETRKHGEYGLDVIGRSPDEFFRVHYDSTDGRMANVEVIKDEHWQMPVHPAHKLMSDEIKALLPDMFSEMDKGEDALAPIKYFTPDANWTWYASEFDGEDIFYGLVIGYEIEYGYFSLSELQSVKGRLGLPIERDLHYEAKSLKELKEYHQKMRGEK